MTDAAGEPGESFGTKQFQEATSVADSCVSDLTAFHQLLADGTTRMNLVGPSAMSEFWLRHAFDSAQLLPLMQDEVVVADIGAGGGFPGVVLAILLKRREGAHVHLIESLGKRAGFLKEVVRALDLPATVHNARAEELQPPPEVPVVTARACAPLPRLLGYAYPLMRGGARGLFLKGRSAAAEIEEAKRIWRFDSRLVESRSDPSGRIVVVETLARARR